MKKVLLYSGGMDSWLIDKLWKPDKKIYVNMNTEYSDIEIGRLPKDVEIVNLPLSQFSLKNSIIPLRNMYLYMIACNVTQFDSVEICLGVLNGDRINDKTQKFANLLNNTLNYLYEEQQSQPKKEVKISMPYKQYSKRELLTQYVEQGGKYKDVYKQTFSCYHPVNNKPCLNCKACFRKAIPFIVAGMQFTPKEKKALKKYYNDIVSNFLDDYLKDKGKEGEDCKKAIKIIKTW